MKNAGKACNNRLYRHIRTFEKIVKNYFVISYKFCIQISKKQTMFFKIAGFPYDGSKKALPTAKLKMCIIKAQSNKSDILTN